MIEIQFASKVWLRSDVKLSTSKVLETSDNLRKIEINVLFTYYIQLNFELSEFFVN